MKSSASIIPEETLRNAGRKAVWAWGINMTQTPTSGYIADDFNGDGKKEIIVRVDDGAKGGGVKCIDSNGKTLWQTEFPLVPVGKDYWFQREHCLFQFRECEQ